MKSAFIRIATRKSPLAMWQAHYVKDQLLRLQSELKIEILALHTQGDKLLATPLNKIGGKGLFIKELELALLEKQADIAVHSLKDLPYELIEDFCIGAYCQRHDPRDVLITNDAANWQTLPKRALVGTSSLRRQAQLMKLRPDLRVEPVRGNVNTRLAKLDAGQFHALILAAAGVERLGLNSRIKQYFATEELLPGAGQGAIGVECRRNDEKTLKLLRSINHTKTEIEVRAERAITQTLAGSCQVPLAAFAKHDDKQLHLTGLVATIDGKTVIQKHAIGDINQPEALGKQVADQLLAAGAAEILELYRE